MHRLMPIALMAMVLAACVHAPPERNAPSTSRVTVDRVGVAISSDEPATVAALDGPTPISKSSTPRKVIGFARWPSIYARSLEDMMSAYDTVVVGRVVRSELITPEEIRRLLVLRGMLPRDPEEVHPSEEGPPPGHPKAGVTIPTEAVEPLPIGTRYLVEVIDVIAGNLSPGQTIPVAQGGWLEGGVAYEIEGDPLLRVGTIYLLFLSEDSSFEWFEGAPFGRLEVGPDNAVRPTSDTWSRRPAVAALNGQPVTEVADRLRDIVAQTTGTK